MKNRLFNNVIFRALYYIARLVILNLIVIVPSFLFLYIYDLCFKDETSVLYTYLALIPAYFYLFPAIVATCHCIINYEMKTSESIFKEFLKSFKENYLYSLIYGLFISVIAALFYNSINFFYHNLSAGAIYVLGFFLSISFAVIICLIIMHLILVLNYYEGCGLIGSIKLACLMAFQDLLITLCVLVVSVALLFVALSGATLVFVTCAAILPIYLLTKLTFKKYYRVYIRTHKEVENEGF